MSKGIGGHTIPNRGATDDWITPPHIIDTLGECDLDPCACDPQPFRTARTMWTRREDGLSREWSGRVWLNPPYSNVWVWMERLCWHGDGFALIFARTETEGFHRTVWGRAQALLFLRGRLHFHAPSGERARGNAGGPSVLVAYGDAAADRLERCGLAGAWIDLR